MASSKKNNRNDSPQQSGKPGQSGSSPASAVSDSSASIGESLVDDAISAAVSIAQDSDSLSPSEDATVTPPSSVATGTILSSDAGALRSMLDSAPINVMCADLDLVVQYANPASIQTLRRLEAYMPIKSDEIVGTNIDVFHANPSVQRRLLSDPSNLPYNTVIELGPEKLELHVSAVRDESGEYVGPMVTWDIITERLMKDNEIARMQSMVESASINIMCADKEGTIQYINQKSRKTLKSIEHLLPLKVDEIVGSSFDVFHKNPSHQRALIADDRSLPIDVFIEIGDEVLDLVVTPMYGADGQYIGPMATWDIVTKSQRKDSEIGRVMKDLAGSAEELTAVSQEMASNAEQTTSQATMVADAARQVSANVQTVASGTEEMSASTQEIAQNASRAASVANEAMNVAEETNKTVAKLGDSSIEIGQVIKVITSIAQQTNLLALNATIEAARAGDAGKGFAVVANEVKELAKETAKATEDISSKIEAIQTDTKNSVTDIERITTIIRQINDIQGTIASAVEEQSVTANEMARNVADANRATDEISQNIASVAEASKETAQGTAGVQLAAVELSKMASDLEGLVAQNSAE